MQWSRIAGFGCSKIRHLSKTNLILEIEQSSIIVGEKANLSGNIFWAKNKITRQDHLHSNTLKFNYYYNYQLFLKQQLT